MRRTLLPLACTLAGLAIGISATWLFTRSGLEPTIPDETVILNIGPPILEGIAVGSRDGIDTMWGRQIKTHAFRMRTRDVLHRVLREMDVQGTAWHGGFDDPGRRLRALEKNLHVRHVPETSILLLWFDCARTSDSRTIANYVARTYLDLTEDELRAKNYSKASLLRTTMRHLSRRVEDIELELSLADDPSEVQRFQLELSSAREHRLRLEQDLEDHGIRTRDRSRRPVTVIRPAIDSDATTGL